MYKYAQVKNFLYDHQLQVYRYAFMYINPQTIPLENRFPAIKTFIVNYKKMSTPGTVPKHWL